MDIKTATQQAVTLFFVLLSAICVLILGSTGARLWWFSARNGADLLTRFLDSVGASGGVLRVHLYAAAVSIALAIFFGTMSLLSPALKRNGTSAQRPVFSRILRTLTLMTVSLVALSGIELYSGWYRAASAYHVLINIHRISGGATLVLILLSAVPFVSRVWSRGWNETTGMPVWLSGLLSIAVVLVVALVWQYRGIPTLESAKATHPATIDGVESPQEWNNAEEIFVPAAGGANFSLGVSGVRVKSTYDKQFIYFLIQWIDSTRSRNRRLIKTSSGWDVLKSDSVTPMGETVFFEDMLAVSISSSSAGCAPSCHLESHDGGSHYTSGDTIDLWLWRAQATDPIGQVDDGWWGGWNAQTSSGRHYDNSPAGGYFSNLNKDWDQPYFLPKPPLLYSWIDLRSSYMTPYFVDEDTFRVDATIPGLLVSPYMGDRGNVRARGQWKAGIWTVELARARRTGSPTDVPFGPPAYLNVALFDNAELAHAVSLRPIRLLLK